MNQRANARAVSLERCKRAAQSPLLVLFFLPFASLIHVFYCNLFFSFNYYLSLKFAISVMFSVTHALVFLAISHHPPSVPAVLLVHFIPCSFHSLDCLVLVGAIISTSWLFPSVLQNSSSTLFSKSRKGRKKKKLQSDDEDGEKNEKKGGTSKRAETKSSLLSL